MVGIAAATITALAAALVIIGVALPGAIQMLRILAN